MSWLDNLFRNAGIPTLDPHASRGTFYGGIMGVVLLHIVIAAVVVPGHATRLSGPHHTSFMQRWYSGFFGRFHPESSSRSKPRTAWRQSALDARMARITSDSGRRSGLTHRVIRVTLHAMNSPFASQFFRWLSLQADRPDAVGEIARFAAADSCWPRQGGVDACVAHARRHDQPESARVAIRSAWSEWDSGGCSNGRNSACEVIGG